MKAIEFNGVNVRIGENQPEYDVLPAMFELIENSNMFKVITCFKLSDDEIKQVNETGCIFLTVLQPHGDKFHPIYGDCLKPVNV